MGVKNSRFEKTKKNQKIARMWVLGHVRPSGCVPFVFPEKATVGRQHNTRIQKIH